MLDVNKSHTDMNLTSTIKYGSVSIYFFHLCVYALPISYWEKKNV